MRRRALLSLLAGFTAGCLSAAEPDTPTSAPPSDSLPPTGDDSLLSFDPGDPFETRTVGEPADDEHGVLLWNDDADGRSIGVRLRDVSTGVTVLDVDHRFPAYGSLRIDVYRRADFVLEVSTAKGTRRLGIRREFVDCNHSETHVAVRPDGSVRSRVISTALACDVGSAPETTRSKPAESSRSTESPQVEPSRSTESPQVESSSSTESPHQTSAASTSVSDGES